MDAFQRIVLRERADRRRCSKAQRQHCGKLMTRYQGRLLGAGCEERRALPCRVSRRVASGASDAGRQCQASPDSLSNGRSRDDKQPLLDSLPADLCHRSCSWRCSSSCRSVQTIWLAMSDNGAPSLANCQRMAGDLNFLPSLRNTFLLTLAVVPVQLPSRSLMGTMVCQGRGGSRNDPVDLDHPARHFRSRRRPRLAVDPAEHRLSELAALLASASSSGRRAG